MKECIPRVERGAFLGGVARAGGMGMGMWVLGVLLRGGFAAGRRGEERVQVVKGDFFSPEGNK